MRIFNDNTKHKAGNTKEEQIDAMLKMMSGLYLNNKIQDIMVIVRTTDEEPCPEGLPQNVFNFLTVDTEYEATVFMRFATDMLFDRMKHIAISDFVKRMEG